MKNRSVLNRDSTLSGVFRVDVRTFRREFILNAAIEVFYNKGYMNSTVDDIAAAMSATKAVVYYNFKSKEDVLDYIIDRSMALSEESINRGIEIGETPAQKLALLCFFYAAHVLKNQKLIALYFREVRNFSPALRRRMVLIRKSLQERVASVLDAGIISREFHPMETHLMAITITGMISIAFDWERESRPERADELCRHFAEQALRIVGFRGSGIDEGAFNLPADGS